MKPSLEPEASGQAVVRTLLMSDLVDSTRFVEEMGDEVAAEIFYQHDRQARLLLEEHGGQEIDKTDGFLMLFERPITALRYALAYHEALAELSRQVEVELSARVGIHLGEVFLRANLPEAVARGAKPLEVEGLAKPTVARLMSLARGRQTLLTQAAFDMSRRSTVGGPVRFDGNLRWLAHGLYSFKGVREKIEIFEVGVEGLAPLRAPSNSAKAQRQDGDQVLGWRPAPGLYVPQRNNWLLEKKLGEGGFGEVWLATQEKTYDRRVFKFCFEAELRQSLQREITLFRLLKETLGEREDINRILDWNFDEAPYFIELAFTEGGSLPEWIEKQGGFAALALATRLELVAAVAEALAAAHSVGVLHKDIKPANVLVYMDRNQHPRPRLTDFGIGRVTDPRHLVDAGITVLGMTEIAQASTQSSSSGTRLYMAPEVLVGKPATVQADIYSLGVVLYQVIVGDFRQALAPGWRREIEDELLREDVAMAVDGRPENRFGNAAQLAERLRGLDRRRRELEAQRRARQESERARQAIAQSRRRWRLAMAGMAVLSLFAVAMMLQVRKTRLEAERANQETQVARQVTDFLVDLFDVSDPGEALGNTITAREILDRGAERINVDLADQPRVRARLLLTVGTVYEKLGLYDQAAPLVEQALAIRRQQLGESDPEVADGMLALAHVYMNQGRLSDAVPLVERAQEIQEGAFGEAHLRVAESLESLASTLAVPGRYDDAEPLFAKALAIRERVLDPDHPDVAGSLQNLAGVYRRQGRNREAEPLLLRAREILERHRPPEHPEVASVLVSLGSLYLDEGRYAEAEDLLERGLAIREKALGPEHPQVGYSLFLLGNLSAARADDAAAEGIYQRSLDLLENALGPHHPLVAYPLGGLARIEGRGGDTAAAEAFYQRSLNIVTNAGIRPRHPDVASLIADFAALLRAAGRAEQAEELEARIAEEP